MRAGGTATTNAAAPSQPPTPLPPLQLSPSATVAYGHAGDED